ncbi:MAG TPA: ChrR family anti-sigma-E factor [Rhizomicrobium sp.]|jgi:putative transcriptional regulator|nr:ChrR family anti-sigma-E factor [Rhizomicrobium sp.]
MIAHHPDDALLMAYASGTADEATGLIVATHLHYCVLCRMRTTEMETIGGSLLEELAPQALAPGALEATLARLDQVKPYDRPRRGTSRDGTPGILRTYLGGDLRDVRWRRMGSKLSYAPLFRRGAVAVRLLRGVPGADSGAHTHQGLEYTLVLQGGYTDVTGSYAPGDLQVMHAGQRHNPVADPGEDCINLAVTTGQLKFDSLIQKIAAPLFGF